MKKVKCCEREYPGNDFKWANPPALQRIPLIQRGSDDTRTPSAWIGLMDRGACSQIQRRVFEREKKCVAAQNSVDSFESRNVWV